ncbi:uncharacterized protein YcbX [Allocatelliglobosispora scoriae]|uniref:Uncharacterized protein YcbX n=1 Tax=Allocatelliglobosispora scoriae TaxID=643052 RepID=A0A841BPV5_9ACTN|nr:MOSC N-terminal beta barrel domain-containing protein [Allocatelliglobosispora scoriae]MBB5868782.1 uncharacterized protein YcbX [Allocatelliglobosispora scoriae]
MSPIVVELVTYPVKGCAGISLPTAVLTPAGLAHDRSFMVIGTDGGFRSQRRDPLLAIIQPSVSADGTRLDLSMPGLEPVGIDVDSTGPRRDVELFGAPFQGIDQGDTVAEWLSAALGAPSRLVRVPPEHARVTGGLTPGTAGYADGAAVLMLSLSSLDLLNQRITDSGGRPVPMGRFRPNIIVGGWDEPHTEDGVERVTIGGGELAHGKVAIRCAVTLVDQGSGVPSGPEPLRTLADYRRMEGGGVGFGTTFAVLRTGGLAVGDDVIVTRRLDRVVAAQRS